MDIVVGGSMGRVSVRTREVRFRPATRLLVPGGLGLVLALSLQGCSESGTVQPVAVQIGDVLRSRLFVSAANTSASSYGRETLGSLGSSASAAVDSIYLSLRPGSIDARVRELLIENMSRAGAGVVVPVTDGGFDPVSFAATEGDSLRVTPAFAAGNLEPVMVKVPAKRPPSVVRSNPPRGRTAVALNALITVVFTEPVDRATVGARSIRLLRDGNDVAGTLLQHADSWVIDFIPKTDLEPNTQYVLRITRDIRNRNGDQLDLDYSIDFTTGATRCEGGSGACDGDTVSGSYSVSGTVFQVTPDDTSIVANAIVNAWVDVGNGNGFAIRGIPVDAAGRYSIGSLPSAAVRVSASAPGLEQHCIYATHTIFGQGKLDILLSRPAVYDLGIGIEFHTLLWNGETATKRYGAAVSGTRVGIEMPEGFEAAWGTTDPQGFANFCGFKRAWQDATVTVSTPGFEIQRWSDKLTAGLGIWIGMVPLQ